MKGIERPKAKTIGELMEETRIMEGAQEYSGHEYLDLNRFKDQVSNDCSDSAAFYLMLSIRLML